MKSNSIKSLVIIILLLIAVSSGSAMAADKKYSGNDYTVSFPSNWSIEKGSGVVEVYSLSPAESTSDRFRENINILSEKIPEQLGLKEYTDVSVKNAGKALTDFKILDRKTITISGKPAERMVYLHNYKGTVLKAAQAIVLSKGKAYLITLTCLPKTYSKYENAFNKALSSFRLK